MIQKTKTDLRGGQHPTWDDQVRGLIWLKLERVCRADTVCLGYASYSREKDNCVSAGV